jgi:hypothetical protein
MHLQPNRNYVSNDDVQTPRALADRIVAHFQPRGRILEPCKGEGNFYRALRAFARTQTRLSDTGYPLSGGRRAKRWPSVHGCPLLAKSGCASEARTNHSKLITNNSHPITTRASRVQWAERKLDRDFFAWRERVDWIVTNPPWSQFREFLCHAMELADHVVFLVTINHVWTRARIRDITTAGFGLKEIVMIDTPATFPPMGFQLGVVHLARQWVGPVQLTDWRTEDAAPVGRRAGSRVAGKSQPRRSSLGQRVPLTNAEVRKLAVASVAAPKPRRPRKLSLRLPSQWMTELAAFSAAEHLRLILQGPSG